MKIEWCKHQGHFEKVQPSLYVFDDELLDTLQVTTSLIHIEEFIQRVIDYHQKPKVQFGNITRKYRAFNNPEISFQLLFWFINNHEIPLESRWNLYSKYAKENWVGKWSEGF